MKRRSLPVFGGFLVVLLIGGYLLYVSGVGVPHPGDYNPAAKSLNLGRDINLMWQTKRLRSSGDPTHGPNPHASTNRAINAASRVFNTVSLQGKTRDEVVALLGDPKASNNSIYNFPFWPAPQGAMVYRFDSGAYGWQFNITFEDDKVVNVKREWIH